MKGYTIIRDDRLVKACCANIDEKNVSTERKHKNNPIWYIAQVRFLRRVQRYV